MSIILFLLQNIYTIGLTREHLRKLTLGVIVFNATFNNISVVSFAVSFIGGGNRRKPPTCLKILTNFIT